MTTYNNVICWLERTLSVEDVRRKLGFQSDMTKIKWYRGLEYSDEFKEDVQAAQSRGVTFHIDPALPVDVVMVAKKKEQEEEDTGKLEEVNYYWVFWVILSEDPGLKGRILFYQFYLSRVSEPYRVKMIIVTAADALPALMSKLREIAEENKFGLWTADVDEEEPTPILEPKTFRDRMVEEFREPKDAKVKKKFPEGIRSRAKDLAMFFDSYVRDAVEAVVGITPEEVGKRNIERRVLDLVYNLENITYHDDLVSQITKFLSRKGSEDKLVRDIFISLWQENLEEDYSGFLEQFDTILMQTSSITGGRPYRDHYLHQFQVFLIGLDIINKFYDDFQKLWANYLKKQKVEEGKIRPIEQAWLVAASFHDMAYPLQLYEKWARSFFGDILGVEGMGDWDLKTAFIGKTFLASMGTLITFFCRAYKGKVPTNWPDEEKELVNFFYKKITEEKIHSVLSSVVLLKGIKKNELFDSVFAPSALSIALHDNGIWESKETRKADEEGLQDNYLEKLKCEEDPLSFLLLFCDNVQEFGRKEKKEKFVLDDIEPEVSGNKRYKVTLWAPNLSGNKPIFKKKQSELEALRSFLRQPTDDVKIEFEIDLLESDKKTRHPYPMRD